MKDFRDYYESLGVGQNATADELKTAYRRAARRYHPDLNPGDETAEEKFKEIGEAYEILSDSDRRSEYDQFIQFLETQKNPSKGLFNLGKKGIKDYSQFKDFSMFVDYLLNRRGEANTPTPSPSPNPPPRASSSAQASGSPTTAQTSAQSTVAQPSASPAPSKTATTAKRTSPPPDKVNAASNPASATPRRSPSPAPAPSPAKTPSQTQSSSSPVSNRKKGSHQTPQTSRTAARSSSQSSQNRSTERSRRSPKSKIQNSVTEAQLTLPLNKAHKGGKERIRLADGRSLTVTLPPGMVSGQTIQVTAHEPSGDRLSLQIQVAPHDFFTLALPDVHCTIPITPSEAILGGPISIPTLDGSVKMVIPTGARSGQKLRLPEKGYAFNGQRGDQIVELDIQMPITVTVRERELYEKIRLTESFRPRKGLYF